MSSLRWTARPELHRPALVAGFEGWNDAGDAASGAIRWLAHAGDAVEIADLDPQEWYDFQAARPTVTIVDGVARSLEWPRTRFLAARFPRGRDLVLVLGAEPNLRWADYCAEILSAATTLDCDPAVTVGALLADVPHTRPVPVTGVAADPDAANRLGLRASRYEGPTGIVGVLHDAARRSPLASISLWASVPHYLATPPQPRATLALLERLDALLGLALPVEPLRTAADTWAEQVRGVVADDEDLTRYVEQLEERFDAAAEEGDDRPDAVPSGDDLAADIEQFLREQGDDRDD